MSERKVLPEKYRQASNLKEGMEVGHEGEWYPIAKLLRIYSPVNMVWVTFADGVEASYRPKDQVMSR